MRSITTANEIHRRSITKDPSMTDSSQLHNTRLLVYFTDVFGIDPEELEAYGAFNVSLISDLPLFIDPFLLFNSPKPEYQTLHAEIIRYVRFLRDKTLAEEVTDGLLEAWFVFREVKQNWLGFSKAGNAGSGLGLEFARALRESLRTVFASFGQEKVTKGSHLEKLALIRHGVGRDNISDFTTTLIKRFLLEYTETFARRFVPPEYRKRFSVERVSFNYETESWSRASFELPVFEGDFVLLTPKDVLTMDDTWINRSDMVHRFEGIAASLPNQALRDLVSHHFRRQLSQKPTANEIRDAKAATIQAHPEMIEYYIREKENDGSKAESISRSKVRLTEQTFIEGLKEGLIRILFESTPFYQTVGTTKDEALKRVLFLKDVIENKDGYRIFWPNGEPIRTENDVQILYRFTWCGTPSDINREVNNGRGPVDFKASRGSFDKSLVEFKLASNTQLKRNLQNQVEIYKKANDTDRALKVITYFRAEERASVDKILKLRGCHSHRRTQGQQAIRFESLSTTAFETWCCRPLPERALDALQRSTPSINTLHRGLQSRWPRSCLSNRSQEPRSFPLRA
jgi:hypothetical protein